MSCEGKRRCDVDACVCVFCVVVVEKNGTDESKYVLHPNTPFGTSKMDSFDHKEQPQTTL